jgi:hypothetical protein
MDPFKAPILPFVAMHHSVECQKCKAVEQAARYSPGITALVSKPAIWHCGAAGS